MKVNWFLALMTWIADIEMRRTENGLSFRDQIVALAEL